MFATIVVTRIITLREFSNEWRATRGLYVTAKLLVLSIFGHRSGLDLYSTLI